MPDGNDRVNVDQEKVKALEMDRTWKSLRFNHSDTHLARCINVPSPYDDDFKELHAIKNPISREFDMPLLHDASGALVFYLHTIK